MTASRYLHMLSRRRLLGRAAAVGGAAALVGLAGPARVGVAHEEHAAGTPTAGGPQAPDECRSKEELAELPALMPMAPDGIEALLGLFDDYPLVALGEDHGVWEIHDFIWSALRHPDFPRKVNALVVEFGNARYQDVIDRYVAGEAVPREELVRVWRDTTQSGITHVWDSPIYEQTYAAVREVNQGLPPEQRIRVLLGDPPIDWSAVRSAADWEAFNRDAHYAEVVDREIVGNGRRALLIAGLLHFQRVPAPPPDFAGSYNPSVIARLDELAPGQTFVLAFASGEPVAIDPDRTVERRLAEELSVPSIARIAGTWLGASGCMTVPGDRTLHLEDQVDGVCYVGPGDTWTVAQPSPFFYAAEPAYFAELQRRHELVTGDPLPLSEPQYVLHGDPGILHRNRQAEGSDDRGEVVEAAPGGPPATPAS